MGRLTSSGPRLPRPAAAPSPTSESGFRRLFRSAAALLLLAGALFAGLTQQAPAQTTPAVSISRHPQQAETATEGATLHFLVSVTPSQSDSINIKLQQSGGAAFGLADRHGHGMGLRAGRDP